MRQSSPGMRAWRFVVVFGVVSMLMDVVYEGARSITGPLLASLGATGLVIGVVTGIGEASALVLRLVTGPLTDRSQRFWAWTIAGYLITAVSVPVLGLAGTLVSASILVIAERVGKAVRSPAKDALLSYASAVTGRGKGFAVHEALDQIGALLGPLIVAGMLLLTGNAYAPSLGVLALPAVAAVAIVLWLRTRVPEPQHYETGGPDHTTHAPISLLAAERLPRRFWVYAGFTATTTLGFATFGIVSFHLVQENVVPIAVVPLLYAAAMGSDAVAALATGWLYDHVGARVLVSLPILVLASTWLAFSTTLWAVVLGALLWGAALGIQESTLRATVADLVPVHRRATAYGLYAGVIGATTLVGGILTGALYDYSVPVLIVVVAVIQVLALVLLWLVRPGTSARAGTTGR